MKPTEAEIANLRKKVNGQQHNVMNTEQLFYLQQAAVSSERLTQNPDWDYFLSQLQEFLNIYQQQADYFKALLCDRRVTDEGAREARLNLLLCQERIATLDAVIQFPVQIKAAGNQAKLALEKIGAEKSDTPPT